MQIGNYNAQLSSMDFNPQSSNGSEFSQSHQISTIPQMCDFQYSLKLLRTLHLCSETQIYRILDYRKKVILVKILLNLDTSLLYIIVRMETLHYLQLQKLTWDPIQVQLLFRPPSLKWRFLKHLVLKELQTIAQFQNSISQQ